VSNDLPLSDALPTAPQAHIHSTQPAQQFVSNDLPLSDALPTAPQAHSVAEFQHNTRCRARAFPSNSLPCLQ